MHSESFLPIEVESASPSMKDISSFEISLFANALIFGEYFTANDSVERLELTKTIHCPPSPTV